MTQGHVRLSGITKTYGSRVVLDDLDLELEPGSMVALLGPSGCGKTTTLRILAGLVSPDSGRVEVDGVEVTHLPVRKRDMGIVFQSYSLFPHMTALQNVEYGLGIRRVPQRRRQAAELLEMVGLQDQADKHPAQMSGGQQQRVALARALAIEPKVLLLDEPLSALDARVRVTLRDEIRRIQQQSGTTTLFVTHDQEEALTIADRVGVMQAGRIVQLDTPERLYSEPASVFVSEFVGVVNRIPGVVGADGMVVLGQQVRGRNPDAPSVGKAIALIRPEDILAEVDPTGESVITQHVLRGPLTSVLVSHPGLPTLLRVDIASPDARNLPVGSRVHLTLRRSDAVIAPTPSVEGVPDASRH